MGVSFVGEYLCRRSLSRRRNTRRLLRGCDCFEWKSRIVISFLCHLGGETTWSGYFSHSGRAVLPRDRMVRFFPVCFCATRACMKAPATQKRYKGYWMDGVFKFVDGFCLRLFPLNTEMVPTYFYPSTYCYPSSER